MRGLGIILMLLAGCADPSLHTGISITPNGVRVTPVASAKLGGATVSISP
ncbi:hypothetical protein [Pseudorhodobacter sp. E13]|nr:hypothetical protein [Pseudorhodobacter sp. E13]